MPVPTAQEVIDAVVTEEFRPNARVMVSKSRGLGQHIPLKPTDRVPEENEDTDIFIHIRELSVSGQGQAGGETPRA